MLNGEILNDVVLNGEGVSVTIAEGLLLSIAQRIDITADEGELLSIAQLVGQRAEGEIVQIAQDVQYLIVASGVLLTIAQQQAALQDDALLYIAQNCIDNTIASHVSRTGWDAIITLGGNIIDPSEIHGMIRVERTEGQAALAEFTIIPPLGQQTIQYYQGQPVTIDVLVPSGTKRIYTGLVDIPEIDLIEKKITFRCTDRRSELINSQLGLVVGSIGYYSPIVFQDVKDVADELEKRLSTTPYSVDFDVFGNYTLTSWFPKVTPDFTLTDSDVYYDRPRVEMTSRARITNKVVVSFQYRYERLHHMQRQFSWTSDVLTQGAINFLRYGLSMTFRSMVASAAASAGWPVRGAINYTPIYPSGWYGGIAWSTVSFTGGTFPKVDAFGDPVLDASGNQVMESRITGGTDYGPLYCMAASWQATTRWAQTVTESYSLSLQAPQSIAQYGEIEAAEQYSAAAEFDSSIWENYEAYNDLGLGNNYYIKQDVNRSQVAFAMTTAMNKAKTTILASHRDTKVIVNTFLFPDVDLRHTVRVETDEVEAKGKVYTVLHEMNVNTGEAVTTTTLALFQSVGSTSNSGLVVPTPPPQEITYPSQPIILGNHFGQDPSQAGAENWTGMIGNRFLTTSLFRTTYQEQFVVHVPAIPDTLRQEQSLSVGASFNVLIPNDELDVFF